MKHLLPPGAPSVWLIVPGSGIQCISRSHVCCILLSKLLLFRSSSWAVSPWTQCKQRHYVVHVCVVMCMRQIVPRVIRLITHRYGVNKSVFASAGRGNCSCGVQSPCSTILSVATRYLDVSLVVRC